MLPDDGQSLDLTLLEQDVLLILELFNAAPIGKGLAAYQRFVAQAQFAKQRQQVAIAHRLLTPIGEQQNGPSQ